MTASCSKIMYVHMIEPATARGLHLRGTYERKIKQLGRSGSLEQAQELMLEYNEELILIEDVLQVAIEESRRPQMTAPRTSRGKRLKASFDKLIKAIEESPSDFPGAAGTSSKCERVNQLRIRYNQELAEFEKSTQTS